ncbi:MAG: hypothetical protein P1S60_13765 [Anaerolineae bacterium]|nr:hypothetical protein [Anaerolineae bacterium]
MKYATDVDASFDGDAYVDLAIGVPYEDVGTIGDAGAVNVVYGSRPHRSHLLQLALHNNRLIGYFVPARQDIQ